MEGLELGSSPDEFRCQISVDPSPPAAPSSTAASNVGSTTAASPIPSGRHHFRVAASHLLARSAPRDSSRFAGSRLPGELQSGPCQGVASAPSYSVLEMLMMEIPGWGKGGERPRQSSGGGRGPYLRRRRSPLRLGRVGAGIVVRQRQGSLVEEAINAAAERRSAGGVGQQRKRVERKASE
jgi:hypothetical protein